MILRYCAQCNKSITRLHGNAKFCKKCIRKRDNERNRIWWLNNDYSKKIAKKRAQNAS